MLLGTSAASRAFAAASLTPLGDLPGGEFESFAYGVSADGSVVVGDSRSSDLPEAFRWTSAGGMVGLGDLLFWSGANGVNADGSVVVGYSFSASGLEAFRWTSAGGMVGLGDLPTGEFNSFANGVSADGSVVVGQGLSADGDEAFRWTANGGMTRLWDVLLANGVDPAADGWTQLVDAEGVNADGITMTIVGYGIRNGNREAFVAVVPEPSSLALLALAAPALGRRQRLKGR
jgi:probable HAF family extracellular repeat protein